MGKLNSDTVPVLFVSVLCICITTTMSAATPHKSAATPHKAAATENSTGGVTLHVQDTQVAIDNGILQVNFSKPQGRIIAIKYNGIENVLQYAPRQSNLGGYWDMDWSPDNKTEATLDMLEGTEFKAVVETADQVEISFKRTWDSSIGNKVSHLNTDVRYIMLRGVSGFYTYTVLEHQHGWPGFDLAEYRLAFKLNPKSFNYMVITDDRHKEMPPLSDRSPPLAEVLDFKEAVLLVKPTDPELKGQVDDKYQYSLDNKDNHVHGWISDETATGFWVITPSNEFKTGGPLKQDLTSHTGPISISYMIGDHYIGKDIHFNLEDGEYWKKTLGPIFIYLNSKSDQTGSARDFLWKDAKAQMGKEVQNWPYSFPASKDYLKKNQRGTVTGKLSVSERSIITNATTNAPYVGLALPGELGSWQAECKGYQFWTRADAHGSFTIENVIPGNYSLYAWAPGVVGDFMRNKTITVASGAKIDLGVLTFTPPRAGPTLWEIGVPDRSAAEFFIPDASPKYSIAIYTKIDKFRQYGLWERYSEMFPKDDLVYNVGTSDYKKDWLYAQVTRKVGTEYHPTTWTINFDLPKVQQSSSYMLRIAIAAAHMARLEVRVNNLDGLSHFKTFVFGDANAIARHGAHGYQWNYEIPIEGKLLNAGKNAIYLTQSFGRYKFNGILYDYIRLEGPVN